MISEKERFNSLKEKIVQLEAELEEKNSIVNQYQSVEKAADSKKTIFFSIYYYFVNSLKFIGFFPHFFHILLHLAIIYHFFFQIF